jgi:hypothetical protein
MMAGSKSDAALVAAGAMPRVMPCAGVMTPRAGVMTPRAGVMTPRAGVTARGAPVTARARARPGSNCDGTARGSADTHGQAGDGQEAAEQKAHNPASGKRSLSVIHAFTHLHWAAVTSTCPVGHNVCASRRCGRTCVPRSGTMHRRGTEVRRSVARVDRPAGIRAEIAAACGGNPLSNRCRFSNCKMVHCVMQRHLHREPSTGDAGRLRDCRLDLQAGATVARGGMAIDTGPWEFGPGSAPPTRAAWQSGMAATSLCPPVREHPG